MIVEDKEIEIIETLNSRIGQVDFDNIPFGRVFSDHMFQTDFIDGKWKKVLVSPYEDLSLAPASSVLHYGQAIFEGMKAFKSVDGRIGLFRPLENAKRLNESAKRMCMPEIPEELFMDGLSKLVRLDKAWIPTSSGSALYIRPFMFANDPYIGVKASEHYKFIIFTGPVGLYYTTPLKLKVERHFARAAKGGFGQAKAAGNYAGSLYPAKLAKEQGYDQLLWTDSVEHEYVEESGTMNIMFVIDGTLLTPPTSDSILNGITRDSALTLARDWGLNVEERPIRVAEIIDAIQNNSLTEAFGIGTAATISHIATIGFEDQDYPLPAIESREISNKLLKALTKIKIGEMEDPHNWIKRI